MRNKQLVIIFIIFIIELLIFEALINYEHIIHKLKGDNRNVPTQYFIINKVKSICKSIVKKDNFMFIDIGCGDGHLLKDICKKNIFNKCIGIEIDKSIYQIAQNKIKTNSNIELHNIDVINYNFELKSTIIYLYEPFFDVEYNKAMVLYHKLFKKLKTLCKKRVYIIYVPGWSRQDIASTSFFNQYGFNIINKYYVRTLLSGRSIYVAKCIY